ncbi:MAG: A/G-specific adenine glycosylase [Candidatus Synoicihabitans palmerolidicus]|nr:A/G-specific adenine glycosylase [Candidatus Synoicihabitans palmerolidicus]
MAIPDLKQSALFQRDLLTWYRAHRRKLPWREAPSLYRTVVSELMLQQTQVKTMLPYFARWMEALPDFATLAAAAEATVLKLWEGLGYYSRARNLHKLARTYVELPAPPTTVAAWRTLPGIGPYTAAAVTSIALGVPSVCVDGNVVRILSRLIADATPYRDSTSAAKVYTPLADSLVPTSEPGDHNQAMMELGATVCHRRNPLCTICPVRVHCAGCAAGDPESYPQLAPKKIEQVSITRAWCIHANALLLHRAPATSRRLAHQHELPEASSLDISDAQITAAPVLAVRKRGITRYAITETIKTLGPPARLPSDELIWVSLSELDTITLSGPHRRWITELLKQA